MLIHATAFLTPYFMPRGPASEKLLRAFRLHPLVSYDETADKLAFGKTDTPEHYTTSADGKLFAHWEPDEREPETYPWIFVGASIAPTSQLLAPLFIPVR